jgi:hypothetical protein
MTDEQTRSVLLVVLGATAIWLWWSGEVLNYVRPGLAPYLLASGMIVGLLGLLPPVGLLGQQTAGPAHGSGGHHHTTRVGWLLLVPVLGGAARPADRARLLRGLGPVGGPRWRRRPVPTVGRPGPGRGPDADGRVRHPRGPRPRPVADRGAGTADRVRRSRRGRRRLPVDPLCHLLLRRRRRSPSGSRPWRPGPPGPGPVAGGRGNLAARPTAVDDPTPPPPVLQADLVRPIAPPRPPYEYAVQFTG